MGYSNSLLVNSTRGFAEWLTATPAPSVSPAGRARVYFDGTSLKVSENGGSYVNLTATLQGAYTSGGAGGGAVSLTLSGGPLAITNPAATAQTAFTVTQGTVGQIAGQFSGGSVVVGAFASAPTPAAGDLGGGNGTNDYLLSPTAGTGTTAFMRVGNPTGKRMTYDQGTGSNGQIRLSNSTNNTPVRIHASGFARFGRGSSTGAEGDLYLGQDGTDGGTASGQYEYNAAQGQAKLKTTAAALSGASNGTTVIRLDGLLGTSRFGRGTQPTGEGSVAFGNDGTVSGSNTNQLKYSSSLGSLTFTSTGGVDKLVLLTGGVGNAEITTNAAPFGLTITSDGGGGMLLQNNNGADLTLHSSGSATSSIVFSTGNLAGATRGRWSTDGPLAFVGILNASAPAVSAADEGRVYYNSTTQKFQVSLNGAAYADLVTVASGSTGFFSNTSNAYDSGLGPINNLVGPPDEFFRIVAPNAAAVQGILIEGGDSTAGDADGGAVGISGGKADGTGQGGLVSIIAGSTSGAGVSTGGELRLLGGPGIGAAASDGGSVTITGGTASSGGGSAGPVVISTPVGVGVNGTSGNIQLLIGANSTTNNQQGRTITLTAGKGGGVGGAGGSVSVTAGQGGDTTVAGDGGAISITAGNAGTVATFSGTGGALLLNGGGGTGTTGNGGEVSIIAGAATGSSATGGAATLRGGNGATGGLTTVQGGNVGATTGNGGSVVVQGGSGGLTSGTPGDATVTGGIATDGNGANVFLTGSAGVGTNRTGGDVNCTPGDATGTALYGAVRLNKGVRVQTTNSITGTTTLTGADPVIVRVDTSATAAFTLTLPAASTVGQGRIFWIKDVGGNAAAQNITISGSGGETINGGATFVINVNYQAVQVFCDGTNWFTL